MVAKNCLNRLICLESRCTPTTFTVSNLADAGPGSLRQAALNANANPGVDTIEFQSGLTGIMTLTSGQIDVNDNLSIISHATMLVGIRSNSASRLFVSNAELTLTGLTMDLSKAVHAPMIGYGGAILSTANLTINDCLFQSNTANIAGGAIYHTGPSLTVVNCSFAGNSSTQGGCIYTTGFVMIQYCRFANSGANNANAAGAGVYLASGTITLDSCSFRACFSSISGLGKGGAVFASGTFFAKNCTFAANDAYEGGAIYLTSGGTLWNCTIAHNQAQSGGSGGGIYGTVTLESTIVSNNSAAAGPDVFGGVTAKYCAMGTMAGFSSYVNQGGNLAFGLDLQMSDDAYFFDGNTLSVSLQKTSPCKNMGSNPAGLQYDTRGPGLVRTAGSAPDIGAFEIQPPPQATFFLNDGSVQRSRVIQLTVTLRRAVKAPMGFSNAFELERASDNAIVTRDVPTLPVPPLTLTTKSLGFSFTGGPIDGNSLADGVYIWTIFSNMLVDESGQYFDGDGDGIEGGDYHSPTTPGDPNRIFRLFGDATGDGFVAANDFIIFRQFFNGVNDMFDFDQDGGVSASDFGQFRLRFGGGI